MKNNVKINVTDCGYEIIATIEGKKYVQTWIQTSTGAKSIRNDFDKIQDERIHEALDSLSGGDLYEMMKSL